MDDFPESEEPRVLLVVAATMFAFGVVLTVLRFGFRLWPINWP